MYRAMVGASIKSLSEGPAGHLPASRSDLLVPAAYEEYKTQSEMPEFQRKACISERLQAIPPGFTEVHQLV